MSIRKPKAEGSHNEDDLAREHLGQRGEKKQDPNQSPPDANTWPNTGNS
jgi:hypothetical protein